MAKSNSPIKKDRVTATNRYSLYELCDIFKISNELMAKSCNDTIKAIKLKASEMGIIGVFDNDLKKNEKVRNKNLEITRQFIRYYNSYDNSLITDRTINYFWYIDKIQPISHLITLSVRKNGEQWLTCFSILQKHCDNFIKTGKAYIPNRGKKSLQGKSGIKKTYTRIEFEDGGRVDLPQNETFKQFKTGIMYANSISEHKVTIPQMTLLAIELFMQNKPEIFGDVLRTIDESKICVSNKQDPNKIYRRVNMYEKTHSRMVPILQRWNMAHSTYKNQCEFLDEAVKGLIDRMDIKYTDPKKFSEFIALNEMNKNI